jgi:nicotinate phosphoribosyltransferase
VGKALQSRPGLSAALRQIRGFVGEIDAVAEGTLVYADAARDATGAPVHVAGAALRIYTPMLQVRTDMVRAKLIETPWLGYINYLCMVASKAARVVLAANGKPVLEFGTRRAHPAAAVDAAYAAYISGASASSNMAATRKWGVPSIGTMDHFAIQAAEQPGRAPTETEGDFFAAFARAFPASSTLLVDTYDTNRGIESAVSATKGHLSGIRIDSNVTPATIARAREILATLNAAHAKVFVSDGLDEHKVAALADLADGFGVGENITCSPDSPTGVGAVAKLVINGYGKVTMKFAKGSGKATLPGELQVHRFSDHDLIALRSEAVPPGGKALLQPVWRGDRPVGQLPTLDETRSLVQQQLAQVPADVRSLEQHERPRSLVASDGLIHEVKRLVEEARLA